MHYAAVDPGDGSLARAADAILTAADFRGEIPFPAQGLPSFSCDRLRLTPFVERPLRLHTSWFARLPPQQAPPGFKPLRFDEIYRGWARRRLYKAMNATADRDFDFWERGESERDPAVSYWEEREGASPLERASPRTARRHAEDERFHGREWPRHSPISAQRR